MGRQSKSQWDFGELFPPEATRQVLTVSELTTRVRRLLEQQVGAVWVGGEITNLRAQSSGHLYFTLKDAFAQLNCVLFKGEPVAHRAALQDGQKVQLQGDLTVYEPRGQYQLIVHQVELQGIGALQIAFEKLKQKLAAEGLFEPARKRPIPRYPQRLGLVTSPTGAALRDVLHVVQRRHPALEIIVAPCRVQGEGAAAEIAGAIRLLNEFSLSAQGRPPWALDLILVTRGGGSLEDLWAFNEEIVARAIAASALPVLSAVGHEIDFTISDFVADLRAATPSAAAELITEGMFASRQFLAEAGTRLPQLARQRLGALHDDVRQLAQRLARVHPRRQIQERLQYLDDLQAALLRCVRQGWRDQRTAWMNLRQRLGRVKPSTLLAQRHQKLHQLHGLMRERARHRWQELQARVAQLESRRRLLSPDNVLQRGYSITLDAASGRILRDAREARAGQRLRTRLKAGDVQSVVATEPEPAGGAAAGAGAS
jgi:exodeoxyribonuclease VII large subunit